MFRKIAGVMVAAVLVGTAVAGCAGETGKSEGDSCSSNNDCEGQLFCEYVNGRGGTFCCPAPLQLPSGQFTSSKQNCQPTN